MQVHPSAEIGLRVQGLSLFVEVEGAEHIVQPTVTGLTGELQFLAEGMVIRNALGKGHRQR